LQTLCVYFGKKIGPPFSGGPGVLSGSGLAWRYGQEGNYQDAPDNQFDNVFDFLLAHDFCGLGKVPFSAHPEYIITGLLRTFISSVLFDFI
jgi:hypothetical protein